MKPARPFSVAPVLAVIAALIAAVFLYSTFFTKNLPNAAPAKTDSDAVANTVELSDTQLKSVKVEAAVQHKFILEKEAVGSIAYHEQDIHDAHSSSMRMLIPISRKAMPLSYI